MRLYPWAIPAIIVLGILSSLAEGIGISLFIPLLQTLDQTSYQLNTGNQLINSLNQLFYNIPPDRRLFVIAITILGSVLLKASLSYGNAILFSWLDARIGHGLRSDLFKQFLTVSYRFLEQDQSGRLGIALSSETWRTNDALKTLVSAIIAACTLTVYIALLLLISWQLTLLVAAAMSLIAIVVRLFTRPVKNLGQKLIRANAKMSVRMWEGLEGMKLVRVFGRESYEQERFDQASRRISGVQFKIGMIGEAVSPIYDILSAVLLVSILLIVLQNPENLAALLVFILVLYRLQPKVRQLDRARVQFASLAAAVGAVTSLLDQTDKPYILSGKVPYQGLKRAIYFDQVTFYHSAKPALQDVSISIPAGQTTALVGPSGAGKTTLVNLILRLYEVTEGEIYIDDQPLRTLDLASWRSRVALVSQETFLFNTTVRENIAYGRLDATEDEIIAAAKLANAHDFISELSEGYETEVGDRGIRLSGGQRQRIALARAIVRNPELLILDEATNALDSVSEHLIQEALETLRENRTVIVIAHRLSTIAEADHIIVLEEGRIREQGDFQHLLEHNGLFAKLYDLQHRKVVA